MTDVVKIIAVTFAGLTVLALFGMPLWDALLNRKPRRTCVEQGCAKLRRRSCGSGCCAHHCDYYCKKKCEPEGTIVVFDDKKSELRN